jgi:RNA polymerase sigma-70 factor (ECF subfamily)
MTPELRREVHAAMSRFADGDRAAFRPVFDALWPVILDFTNRMLRDEAEAEDAAQRALLKVFHRISQLDRNRDGVAWAMTIAAYEAMTLRNRRTRRREEPDERVRVIEDAAPSQCDRLIAEQLRAAVHAAIGELGPRDQAALQAVLDDQPHRGETVRKRRFRAVARLREAWRKAHG